MAQTEIAEILTDMQSENERNVNNFEKLLTGISTKLELMSEDDEATELIRFYISELKKAVEEKHSATILKLESFGNTFENIISMHDQLAKTSELKELFEIFSAHGDSFVAEISNQKTILDDIDLKISKIDDKTADKNELLSIVHDISDYLKELDANIHNTFSQTEESLKRLDPSEHFEKIQHAIDVLSAHVDAVPERISYADLEHKFDDLLGVLDKLKVFVAEAFEQKGDLVVEKFTKLEDDFGAIVTSSDFSGFRTDLADFVQKIIDNSSALNSELSYSTEKIESILSALNNFDFKDDFGNINERIADIKNTLQEKAELNCTKLSSQITEFTGNLNEKFANFDTKRQEIYSDLKNNLFEVLADLKTLNEKSYEKSFEQVFSILDQLQADISAMTTQVGVDVQENYTIMKANVETLITNLQIVKEDLAGKEDLLYNLASKNLSEIQDKLNNIEDVGNKALEISQSNKNLLEEMETCVHKNTDNISILSTDVTINREKLIEIAQNLEKVEPLDFSYDIQQISTKLDDNMLETSANIARFDEKFEEIKNSVENLDNSQIVKEQFENFEKAFCKIVTNDDFLNFKTEFADFLQKIIDNSKALYDSSTEAREQSQDTFERINASIADLSTNVCYLRDLSEHKSTEITENISNNFNTAINEASNSINSNVKLNLGDLRTSVEKITSQVESAKEDFVHRLDANVFNLTTGFDNVQNRLEQISNLRDNIDGIKEHINEISQSLREYITELGENENSIKAASDEKFIQKLLDLETLFVQNSHEYEHKLELLQSKIIEFAHIVENSNSDTEGKIASALEEITSIKDELTNINESLKTVTNDEQLSNIVSLIDAGVENITFNVNNISSTVAGEVEVFIKEGISAVDEKLEKMFNILDECKNSQYNIDFINNVEEKLSALKDELGLVNSDVTEIVQAKAEYITDAIKPIKDSLDEFLAFDFEKIISDLKSQVELSFMNFSVDINGEFASNAEAMSRLEQAYKEIFSKLSVIEEYTGEKIQNNIEILKLELETSVRDIKVNIEGKIEEQINELKDYFDVTLNNNNTKAETSMNSLKDDLLIRVEATNAKSDVLKNSIDEISSKCDVLISNSSTKELNKNIEELSRTEENVADMLSALHAKVDVLASDGSDLDILEELDGIKGIIFEQRKFFEASSDEKAAAIDKYLRDVLLKLDSVDLDKNAEDIKDTILNALLSLVDQISFVEETEEIKDFVEEKTEEINQSLIEVKNQLKQLTSTGDDFDYSYSLQDVETDIAKLRLAINNMSGNDFSDITDEIKKIVNAVEELEASLTQEQIVDLKTDIEKLSEDIVSISSRTNKLLLTSDESYKALNDGLNNFSNVIYKLEDRINYLDNTEISERIESKIDNIHTMTVEASNADKVFHQVMTYLGEWIDTAGENINVIDEKVTEISEIKDEIQQLKDFVPEKIELLNEIENKFKNQEERINQLEMKLDKILSTIEEKDDTVLNRKVDKIEKLLSKLGTNIEKLASYVDEE